MGCLISAIMAFILFTMLYRDEFLWFLKSIPDFIKNLTLSISKAWNFAVKGIMIDCKPLKKLKTKNRKDRDCKVNNAMRKAKQAEDTVDEDKGKEIDIENANSSDNIEGFNDKKEVFYMNIKQSSPIDVVGYTTKKMAKKACESVNSQLATKDLVMDSYNNDGIDWCKYGWVDSDSSEICLPLQDDTYNKLTKSQRISGYCGSAQGSGVNCSMPIKNEKYGALCHGIKPNNIVQYQIM